MKSSTELILFCSVSVLFLILIIILLGWHGVGIMKIFIQPTRTDNAIVKGYVVIFNALCAMSVYMLRYCKVRKNIFIKILLVININIKLYLKYIQITLPKKNSAEEFEGIFFQIISPEPIPNTHITYDKQQLIFNCVHRAWPV